AVLRCPRIRSTGEHCAAELARPRRGPADRDPQAHAGPVVPSPPRDLEASVLDDVARLERQAHRDAGGGERAEDAVVPRRDEPAARSHERTAGEEAAPGAPRHREGARQAVLGTGAHGPRVEVLVLRLVGARAWDVDRRALDRKVGALVETAP